MALKLPIYMDHNATTPIEPRVLEAMMPYLTDKFGNAASKIHLFGEQAKSAVESARKQIASLIGATDKAIVFTSGATESNNLAIKGVAEMYKDKGRHIITCLAEHKAVIDPCRHLAQQACDITWLKPDEFGRVSADQVAEAITDKTILISIMAANNEIGTINPIARIGKLAKERQVLFHCDATQAVGKIPVDVEKMGIDLLSLSAHKIYGPKGIGALYVRRQQPRVRLKCQMDGGGHERGMRSGTLNVPGIVGLGAAAEIAAKEMEGQAVRLTRLRDRLQEIITADLTDVKLNGHPTERLPNTLNLSFAYVEGEAIVLDLVGDAAVSTGSACSSESLESSHVLSAIGVPAVLAHGSIRFSLGRSTTADQIEHVGKRMIEVINRRREMSPIPEMKEMFDA